MQQCLKKIIFLSVNINIYWNNIVSGNIATLNKNFMVVKKKPLEIQRIGNVFSQKEKNILKRQKSDPPEFCSTGSDWVTVKYISLVRNTEPR